MKMRKVFGACALLLALTVVGCGKGEASSEASKNSSKPASTQQSTNKPATTTSAAPASTTSAAPAEDPLWTPLARTWTEGTAVANSAGKNYIPLTDATANKVGVKIAIKDYEVAEGATESSNLSSDGKIGPVNDHQAALAWKVKAPKAGDYQLVMTGKCKADATDYTLSQRAFAVTLNGEAVDVAAEDRIAVTTEAAPFVAAPRMTLRGTEEDVITVTCTDYRIQFDVTSFLVFQEI